MVEMSQQLKGPDQLFYSFVQYCTPYKVVPRPLTTLLTDPRKAVSSVRFFGSGAQVIFILFSDSFEPYLVILQPKHATLVIGNRHWSFLIFADSHST